MYTDADELDPLLSIGVFARRSWLSMKALRLYDRRGLLRPAAVDPDTGYRAYRESQLFRARLIEMLRRLDMPLSEIAKIVDAPGPRGAELLAEYWNQIERRITEQRTIAENLRLSLLGGDRRFEQFHVAERAVPEQVVVADRRHLQVGELAPWLTNTKRRLVTAAERTGGRSGRVFVIFHGPVTKDNDGPVEVCVPVAAASTVAGGAAGIGGDTDAGFTVRSEPAHVEAYVGVSEAQFELPQILTAYDAVERWIGEHGGRPTAAPREIYTDPEDQGEPAGLGGATRAGAVCEVAWPFRRP